MPDLDPRLTEAPYPIQSHLGYRLSAWRDGFARLELPLEDFLTNRHGILHGGIHGVMADTAMGFAGCYTGDPERRQMAMTLNLSVNFLAPAKGSLLIAEGIRTGGGARTFFAEAKMTDSEGTLCATATGVFRLRGR
ncbi:PaaI family thioesterase [Pseudooceanicola sp. CBS1P-1]|uniref:Hotdog fold thioesterase n=1 Tax=Pseudooceanicola albus TaxID=2692189 RepID=A0A6L7GAM8_9RHOB|nr:MULTISPECIES: PaaI family thioesterase [Pseudooceanicola]MBT9384077.1 PaaI family thioesterase [Pseudooceanicola endophyticus]MXN19823.1 hotdog fold thioesterase [Pseudooceanicola albus]